MKNLIFAVVVLFGIYAQASALATTTLESNETESAQIDPISISADWLEPELNLFGEGLQSFDIPFSSKVFASEFLEKNHIRKLSDLVFVDPAVGDSYNASGYWYYLSIRGIILDSRYNYYRDGLPILSLTHIPLDNKDAIEVLKGLSGIQGGASSPGGMVNYRIKRPLFRQTTRIQTEHQDSGSWYLGLDKNGFIGGSQDFGYRANLGLEKLNAPVVNSAGERGSLSLATSWRALQRTLLEAEIELNKRAQPTQAGASLLGDKLPDSIDPTINLNNQKWSQPLETEGMSASITLAHFFLNGVSWKNSVGLQKLVNQDRLTYPYGCDKEGRYDRYCSDGTFDVYDFRSENERKEVLSYRSDLNIDYSLANTQNKMGAALVASQIKEHYDRQAYNLVGTGNIEGNFEVPENATINDENTNRFSDILQLNFFNRTQISNFSLWLGAKAMRIDRNSVRTDGSRASGYDKQFLLPWYSLSYNVADQSKAFASYSEGIETYVVPNRTGYTNPGAFVPDAISKQYELGYRIEAENDRFGVSLFHISRPQVFDERPLYVLDGKYIHQGIESDYEKKFERIKLSVGGLLLDARLKKSQYSSGLNNKRPVNVANYSLRASVEYQLENIPTLNLSLRWTQESEKKVDALNTIEIPAWHRLDLGARYATKILGEKVSFFSYVTNLLDRRYWQEAPTQYSHIYLYPGQERVVSLGAIVDLK